MIGGERGGWRMTAITQTLREQGFRTLECDIPHELTIAQYRRRRARRARRVRAAALLARLRRADA